MWLELKKSPATDRPVSELKAPIKIFLPLKQFKGAMPSICVKEGERVLLGQPVAKSAEGISCALHSPVSGTVTEITVTEQLEGERSPVIVIENDGKDIPYKRQLNSRSPLPKGAAVIEAVSSYAVVAAESDLPLWVRLAEMAEKKVKTIIINAVESEPYICSSQKIMEENAEEVAQGLMLIMSAAGAKSAMLAVSDDVPSEIIEGVKNNARLQGIALKVVHVPQKYPLGIERYLICHLIAHGEIGSQNNTKKTLTADVDAEFVYAEDCLNVSRAAAGRPQLSRIITVAGDAVGNPQNLEVRIGSTVRDVLDHCGLSFEPDRVVIGGAMRGVAASSLDTPITKTVSAVLALRHERPGSTKSICINCGRCVGVCPEGLLPNYIAMRAVKADFDALRALYINECRECGLCSYVCPGRMPIVELIKNIKKAAL